MSDFSHINHQCKNETQPLVSVIIPTYNRLSLLLEAIESVKNQTYQNWELIIVDDGSTDDTVNFIQKIEDDCIHIICEKHHGHLGILRNVGARHSKGEWLAFLDSDDLWLSQKLELQIDTLIKERTLWNYCCSEIIDENKNSIANTSHVSPGWIVEKILKTTVDFSISSLVVAANFFYELNGFTTDSKLFCREDHEFTLRLALHAPASAVSKVLVQVRQHSDRTTNSLSYSYERTAEVYTSFLKYNCDKKYNREALKRRGFHLSEAAVNRFGQGEYKHAIKQLKRSLQDGDNLRHWLSAVKRGIYAVGKKHF